jgi:hypothetical protein
MSCDHDCAKPEAYPRQLFNRPALDSIDYRVGTYSRMREHMLALLNENTVLKDWTHRGADDPGIALLEGNAIVGDILAFYQNLYANQAYLRSADWLEAVSELVQLTGYRLSPAVGGEAAFALKIKGDASVTVPRGFGFKAGLQGRDQDDEFESTAELTAWPQLGEFYLYAPPKPPQAIQKNDNQLELQAVGGSGALSALQAVDIKAGDRIMLVPDSDMFDLTGTDYSNQEKPETLKVEAVEFVLNRLLITFEGKLRYNRGSSIRAFKIDRSFSHFGYNAASRVSYYDGVTTVTEATAFERNIYGSFSDSSRTPTANTLSPAPPSVTLYSGFGLADMALDKPIDDLVTGGLLICEGIADFEDGTASGTPQRNNQPFIVVRTIEAVRAGSVIWGNMEANTSIVTLDSQLMSNTGIWFETMDIRRTRFHEVVGEELTLAAVTEFDDGDFSDGLLNYFGSYAQVQALAERELLLQDNSSEQLQQVTTTSTLDDFTAQLAARDATNTWLWDVTLDQFPTFPRTAFSQSDPAISVYGNIVHADQGKTIAETVLGSGDNREGFQTFALPKSPLTYLLDASSTPAEVPELSVYVDGILWTRVDTFFNQAFDAQVYVVRQDSAEKSYIQFGDGKQGARLPAGINNVTAVYKTGAGATGVLQDGKKPTAVGKLSALEKTLLPGEAVGGAEAETMDNARETAPGRMQSLGRLVGLADYEAEVLAVPGVQRVRADWAAPNGVAVILIRVLTEAGTAASVDKVRATLTGYNRCRGPARFPVLVQRGLLQYVYLNLRAGYEAKYKPEDVNAGIKLALGVIGEEGDGIETTSGLFSWQTRRFGQNAHRSQILAAVQNVDGVTWVEIDDAQRIELGDPPQTDPLALSKPGVPSTTKTIDCEPARLLALHGDHLDIGLILDTALTECEA